MDIQKTKEFVNVTWDYPGDNSWDTHADNFNWLRGALPTLDRTYSALLQDLEGRGLLDETLVVMMSDMGRTPQVKVLLVSPIIRPPGSWLRRGRPRRTRWRGPASHRAV